MDSVTEQTPIGLRADTHPEANEPHMPAPSLSPLILAAGMTMAAFGIVLGPLLIILGVVAFLIGLGTWLYDEIVNASAVGDDSEPNDAHR